LDDKSTIPWHEYKKGIIDLIISILVSVTLFQINSVWWIPFSTQTFEIPAYIFLPISTFILWFSINSLNCSDGIDGLSGSLSFISLASFAILFYFVVGHINVAEYLQIPYYPYSTYLANETIIMCGILLGYLWHNAYPSTILMGDAGSRPIGLFIGILVILSGNPFLWLTSSLIILINGGTGLFKIAFIRFLRLSFFRKIRFPLHDHYRNKYQWTPTQIIFRFSILQIIFLVVIMIIILKIR